MFDTKVWKEIFQVNLFALVLCTDEAVKLMRDGGELLNISSIYGEGKACWKGLPAYGASKAAIPLLLQFVASKFDNSDLVLSHSM